MVTRNQNKKRKLFDMAIELISLLATFFISKRGK